MRLAVELNGLIIGTLQGDSRSFDFVPDGSAMQRLGTNSLALSVAIPLTPALRRDHAGRRRNWFTELLPEGDQYEHMLRLADLRRGDTPAFLAKYGRDVAGALQLWDLDDPTEPLTPNITPISDDRVRELLEDPIGSPLANLPATGKSSLGGVQPKIVLVRVKSGWAQSSGGYPTTHILKPQLSGLHASTIFDEEYGSRLARGFGLTQFPSVVHSFDGLNTLVIERFDRQDGTRIHQEDFNQILGASGNQKYQEMGGVVSLSRIAQVLRSQVNGSSVQTLARMVVLAVAIGNLDMHTKNLGLLHPAGQPISLAPAYDVVPQVHKPNDGRMALAVNKKYVHASLTVEDLVAEFASWDLKRPKALVENSLEELAAISAREAPLDGAHSALQDDILGFIHNLQNGKPVGHAN